MSRIEKALKERIYLLDYKDEEESCLKFLVEGSSGRKYSVKFSDTVCECTCPDYRTRKLMCKHIIFLLVRVFKNDKNINQEIEQNFLGMINIEVLKKEISKINNEDSKDKVVSEVIKDENCLICFEELDNDNIKCKICIARCHNECINRWLKNKKTCPMCRSVWSNDNKDDNVVNGYLKLNIK